LQTGIQVSLKEYVFLRAPGDLGALKSCAPGSTLLWACQYAWKEIRVGEMTRLSTLSHWCALMGLGWNLLEVGPTGERVEIEVTSVIG
jgi:hypothetical protein